MTMNIVYLIATPFARNRYCHARHAVGHAETSNNLTSNNQKSKKPSKNQTSKNQFDGLPNTYKKVFSKTLKNKLTLWFVTRNTSARIYVWHVTVVETTFMVWIV
jgi:hypothetical protein